MTNDEHFKKWRDSAQGRIFEKTVAEFFGHPVIRTECQLDEDEPIYNEDGTCLGHCLCFDKGAPCEYCGMMPGEHAEDWE